MGVGHLAAALMLKRADPRINLGLLFFAVLLSDFLLGVFFWAGLETATVPTDFENVHYLNFTFPFSHGLAASLIWSLVIFGLSFFLWQAGGVRGALILFLAVLSHFILDAIVHVPGVPLLGHDSARVGLKLWQQMGLALTIEMLLVAVALGLFWPVANKNFRGKWGILIVVVLVAIMTAFGMTAPTPPDLYSLGIGWLAFPVILSVITFLLDWKSRANA